MKDMHNAIKVVHAITPQAVGTSGIANGKLSAIIDRQGYDSVEYIYQAGATASVADQVVPVVYECATTGGTFTSVADADLLGTEAALVLTAAKTGKVGYRGNKRYTRMRLYSVGHATGLVGAVAVLANAEQAPVA
jgi:hypothetical protein